MKEFYRGGGTIANTLNAVPERIDKMLKENYKKIAIIEDIELYFPNKEINNITKELSLDFIPNRFIISVGFKHLNQIVYSVAMDTMLMNSLYVTAVVVIESFEFKNNTIKLRMKNLRGDTEYLYLTIIAIE